MRRFFLIAVTALLVLSCGSSLTDAEWLWCNGNSNRVTGSARHLGLATNPGWWTRCESAGDTSQISADAYTQLMIGSQNYYACVSSDTEYIAACRAVALADSGPAAGGGALSASEIQFCEKSPQWTETRAQSLSMGQHWFPSTTGTPSWVIRSVAAENLRGDADYVRACEAAFNVRSG